ncbi:DEAD-box ATP-dependent RNA helicase 3, chloroplastic [Galdieria sulphuraria]|nr:DEAD-box ATP-dependent RNA helicase 3, chloroplastic [Galdieria sulphuraria]
MDFHNLSREETMVGGGDAFIGVGRFANCCTFCSRYYYSRDRKSISFEKQFEILLSAKSSSFNGHKDFIKGLEATDNPCKIFHPHFSRDCPNIHLRKQLFTESKRLSGAEDEFLRSSVTDGVFRESHPSSSRSVKETRASTSFFDPTVTRSRGSSRKISANSTSAKLHSNNTRVSKKPASLQVVEANETPVPFTSFQLSKKILEILEERGLRDATPIQSATFELIYSGRDIIGRSRTGTGKTLAFVLPIMQKLVEQLETHNIDRVSEIQCLVLAPTRELAKQVEQEFSAFAKCFRFRTSCFFGGSSYEVQQRAIKRGIDILVATPGRLIDLLERGSVDLLKVKFFVLDEADEMLSMGFAEDIDKISTYLPPTRERQTLLFSATIPPWVQELAKSNKNNPIIVDAIGNKDTKTSTTVEHIALRVPPTELSRKLILESVISVYSAEMTNFRCIVFARTKAEVDSLVSSGRIHNGAAQALHGDITQKQREITLSKFREGSFQVLIATDVAARGLDINGVDLVIQYRVPEDIDMYIHRAGRTGRAGRQGTCIILYTDEERNKLTLMENVCKIRFRLESPPSIQQVIETKANGFLRASQAVEGKWVEPLIPVVKEYIESLHIEGEEREKQFPFVLASLLAVAMGQLNMPQS